ncbi:OLC1v1020333C1 [Oldenlandia corymbosa var. corymbosa]|uniref:OLC1v1020333C1 n=1 Tax=Oldenlandia corymbosa var. corymbosa TaxID=529605 RepID=A0AAV1EGC7_OLDCO|nr:OLC1v1020333C1 [Oldenlandia corymbosa var. corymbosa]
MNCEKLKRPKEEREEEEEEEIGKLLLGIMEGYKDSVIPALSDLKPTDGLKICEMGSINLGKKPRFEAPETEFSQKGDNKLTQNFAVLQSSVPSLIPNPKPTKVKIVTETITYIKSLETEVKRLEKLKRSVVSQKPGLSGCSTYFQKPSVSATIINDTAFFGIQLPAKKGSLCKVFEVFQKYQAEVFEVTVLVNDQRVLTITGTFTVGSDGYEAVEKIKEEILGLRI